MIASWDVARKVLTQLEPELKKGRPVSIRMDFGGYDRTKPVENTTGFLSSSGTKVFKKRWMLLSFTLMDGTQVLMEAAELCKRKQKAKRKYTKMKDNIADELSITLRPPRGKAHASTGALPPMMQQMNPRLLKAQVKSRAAVFQFRTQAGTRLRAPRGMDGALGPEQPPVGKQCPRRADHQLPDRDVRGRTFVTSLHFRVRRRPHHRGALPPGSAPGLGRRGGLRRSI